MVTPPEWSSIKSAIVYKVVATAPGHVNEVRRLVFGPLTKTQTNQLTTIGQRIMRAIDPDDRCLIDRTT
jgi:hypothetical protein